MKKLEMKTIQKIIPIFFLLVFVEIAILGLKDKISLINLIEITAALFLTILYYFLIRTEFRITSKELEKTLNILINRFDRIEDDLKEELKTLSEEIKELKKTLKKER